MQRTARKMFGRIVAFMLFFALLFGMCAGGVSARVYADTGGELNYDNTNVLDDLKSATVNGEPFDLAAYPRNPFGTPQVILCRILLFPVRKRKRELCVVRVCI